ncbi:hypothetical protein Tco_0666031 [Tanacetum coccineum]
MSVVGLFILVAVLCYETASFRAAAIVLDFFPLENVRMRLVGGGSDDDGVPETVFGSNTSSPNQVNRGKENSKSEDPFGIYDMLANKKDNVTSESRPSLSHPPGFTPEGVVHHEKMGTANGVG